MFFKPEGIKILKKKLRHIMSVFNMYTMLFRDPHNSNATI